MRKVFIIILGVCLLLMTCLCMLTGCGSETSYKYHTFVYAYNVDDPSRQGCIVVCGEPSDDAIWVDLPISYDDVSSVLDEDSTFFWHVKIEEMLHNSESPHIFIKTRTDDRGYTLYENNTNFTIGIRESADYVSFETLESRIPIEVPIRRKVVEYEK